MTKQLLQRALDYVENVPDDRCWGDYQDHAALETELRAAIDAPEEHTYGKWCTYLRCIKCYSAGFRLRHTPFDTEGLRKENQRLLKALNDATLSLETFMETFSEVRGYAISRVGAGREAIAAQGGKV